MRRTGVFLIAQQETAVGLQRTGVPGVRHGGRAAFLSYDPPVTARVTAAGAGVEV